ncbi:MAG: hypothetical protein Q6365_007665 [Candidatus Sigynarchaeota archaeon]
MKHLRDNRERAVDDPRPAAVFIKISDGEGPASVLAGGIQQRGCAPGGPRGGCERRY